MDKSLSIYPTKSILLVKPTYLLNNRHTFDLCSLIRIQSRLGSIPNGADPMVEWLVVLLYLVLYTFCPPIISHATITRSLSSRVELHECCSLLCPENEHNPATFVLPIIPS